MPHVPVRPTAALGACLLLAGGLSACGGSGGSGGGASSKNTLVIAEWTNDAAVRETERINKIFEKEHPGVKVKLQTAPTANSGWPTLTNSLLASKNVDVLAEFPPTPGGFPPAYTGLKTSGQAALATSGQLEDLTNQPFMKKYEPTLQQYATGYNGKIYGVMAAEYVNNSGLWYKKDVLAKNGIAVPTTFNEFIAACKKLKAKGVTPVFVAAKDGYQNILWQGIINQLVMKDTPAADATKVNLARAKDFWDGKAHWNDPLYKDAASRYEQVMQYIEPAAAGVPAQTAPGVWANQESNYPFFIDGSYDGNTITEANPKLNLGFMSFPGTDNAAWNRPVIFPDLTWTVPTWAKHKKLAMEWLELFSRPENYSHWVKTTGSLSTQTGVKTPTLKWTDWLTANIDKGFPGLTNPWVPTGAPTAAGGPDLSKMKPIGSTDSDKALNDSAKAYDKARKR